MSFLAEVCKGSDPPNPLTSLSNKPLACLASSGLMKSILNREKSFIVTPMPNTKSYSNCPLESIVITYQNKYYLEGTKIVSGIGNQCNPGSIPCSRTKTTTRDGSFVLPKCKALQC